MSGYGPLAGHQLLPIVAPEPFPDESVQVVVERPKLLPQLVQVPLEILGLILAAPVSTRVRKTCCGDGPG